VARERKISQKEIEHPNKNSTFGSESVLIRYGTSVVRWGSIASIAVDFNVHFARVVFAGLFEDVECGLGRSVSYISS
jgi:hypothetical protein